MYEPTYKLERKARYGSESAKDELQKRKNNHISTGLFGIHNESIFFVKTESLVAMLDYILSNITRVDSSKSMERANIILDSYSSATIEGARTTVQRIQELVNKSSMVSLNKSEQMVLNSVKAYNFAYNNKIGLENIRFVFEVLTNGVCENESVKGSYFRDGDVFVGNEHKIIHTPCRVNDIHAKMNELFQWLDSSKLHCILKSCIAHFYLVYVHPFCDGNGRLARLFNTSYLVNNGFDKFKYISISDSINSNLQGYSTVI